ncbi:MAG: 6-phosphofructokinase [Candidatus Improbicoccus devescovinae]|nr:MAG: 6-phosphofructokinase [Candidatus Improbicoccus devescovinae]
MVLGCKNIGILTSGGDAPGMNAAIRAVVRSACARGIRTFGIRRGYNGLINNDIFEMNLRSVSDIIERGGTVLYTARSPEFTTKEGIRRAVENCKYMGLDGLVIIGGDGSIRGAKAFCDTYMKFVCLPGTIDNDIACSEYSIGFDTAMNTAMNMIDKIRDTAQSHDRCSVIEVMGHRCGDIAVRTGIAVGATAILIPEVTFDFKRDIIKRISFTQKIGKKHFIIIVSEGLRKANDITSEIAKQTGIDSRVTILGHVQRGGSPTAMDRLIASEMGCHAVALLSKGISNKIISIKNNKIVDIDIDIAIKSHKPFNFKLYEKALEISI